MGFCSLVARSPPAASACQVGEGEDSEGHSHRHNDNRSKDFHPTLHLKLLEIGAHLRPIAGRLHSSQTGLEAADKDYGAGYSDGCEVHPQPFTIVLPTIGTTVEGSGKMTHDCTASCEVILTIQVRCHHISGREPSTSDSSQKA